MERNLFVVFLFVCLTATARAQGTDALTRYDGRLGRYAILQQIGTPDGLNGCHFAVNQKRIDEYAAFRAELLTKLSDIPANGFAQNWAKRFTNEIQVSFLLKSCEDWKSYAKRLALLATEDQGDSPLTPESESDWIDVPVQRARPSNEVDLPDKYRRSLVAQKRVVRAVVFAVQSWTENAMGVRTYGWWGNSLFKNEKTGDQFLPSSITTSVQIADSELRAALVDRNCATVDREETQVTVAGAYGNLFSNIEVGQVRFRVDGLPKMPRPKCFFLVSGKYFKGPNYTGFKDVKLAAPLNSY
ncbi:hypothetical protein [Bradyrhizobium elkanii]|uniref:hypothetical protein n=1 Tax=Bradyrhizobium elkanii TaxID=29448 RepID=UPI00144A1A1C|nr:hypothetical protein [Bradyrhizobium elkanii]MCS3576552.1 hypothetical protein [Bradyrhizobium elkanii]MCS3719441.1 hypothetical protein [Bradyrhizobium elkanii]MCS4003846.1 hypothetical protein [Bradyrhizobium elkanii USDA 61]BBB99010.1 hypothetical protein BE61_44510 [Bradyrhizobium elkanii USDA 61]